MIFKVIQFVRIILVVILTYFKIIDIEINFISLKKLCHFINLFINKQFFEFLFFEFPTAIVSMNLLIIIDTLINNTINIVFTERLTPYF